MAQVIEGRRPEEGQITDEAVERLRLRVGVPVPQLEPSFEFASVDNMRNYAKGIGDINPMYRDPEYARRSPWGSFAAHPTFMLYMGRSVEQSYPDDLVERTGRGDPLAGVHAFYSGVDIEWTSRIEEGDRMTVRGGLASAEVRRSRMGGQAVHQWTERAYRNQREELVGVHRELLIRVERSAARSTGKYSSLDVPHSYTEAELEAIEKDYEREYIRGEEPRYWEDLEVGEALVPLLKGPYTVTAYICYAEGTGPRNAFHRAHSVAYRYRKEHPRAFPPNDFGYPDTVARVHWDRSMAARAGLPETYDYGGERVAWMSHAVTHWMGDVAFLRRLQLQVKAFCFVGDTVWIGGRVERKYEEKGEKRAEVSLSAKNQRDEEISSGMATVILPSRSDASLPLPSGRFLIAPSVFA